MMQHGARGSFRVLALVLVAVLLQAVVISLDCTVMTARARTSIQASNDFQNEPCDHDNCCLLCFCCHYIAAVHSSDRWVHLVTKGFLAALWNPAVSQQSISPFDRPPRA